MMDFRQGNAVRHDVVAGSARAGLAVSDEIISVDGKNAQDFVL